MRSLTSDALTAIATEQGGEPIILIGITWTDGGQEILYGDKDYPGVLGRIVGNISLNIEADYTGITQIGEVSVTLIDVDGTLKNYFDTYDLHKRPVNVYQWFSGLSLTNKFAIFPCAQMVSPITWDEAARTLSFSVSSKIEDLETGFSTESSALDKLVDGKEKNWPLCFGDCLYVPATQVNTAPVGNLTTPFGFVDPVLLRKRAILAARNQTFAAQLAYFGAYYGIVGAYAPDAAVVLARYIQIIGEEDALVRDIQRLLKECDAFDDKIKKANGNKRKIDFFNRRKKYRMKKVDALTKQVTQKVAQKDEVNVYIQAIQYEAQVRNSVIEKMSELIRSIYDTNQDIAKLDSDIEKQRETEVTSITVEDGSKFTEGDIVINNVRFSGSWSGDTFTFASRALPRYTGVSCRPGKGDTFYVDDPTVILTGLSCLVTTGRGTFIIQVTNQVYDRCTFTLVEKKQPEVTEDNIPQYQDGSGVQRWEITPQSQAALTAVNAFPIEDTERAAIIQLENLVTIENTLNFPQVIATSDESPYQVIGEEISSILEASPIVLEGWLGTMSDEDINGAGSGYFFADAGSDVSQTKNLPISFIANVAPSTIYGVYAYRTHNSVKRLEQLPSNFYTKYPSKNLNGLNVTAVTLKQPLSKYANLGWEDQIYVTLRSSLNSNPCQVIIWLLQNYTPFSYDSSSFASVQSKLTKYPCHFAVFERKNVIQFIKDIAFQSRCAVWLKDNKYYIKYLSEEPTSVDTITDDDIVLESLSLSVTDTENLGTKVVASWQPNYLPDSQQTVTVRYNVTKYGTQEYPIDFYCYTNRSLVEKSATFWMIRKANSWKKIAFRTVLTKLNLEPFDAITLTLDCLGGSPIIALVEKADYNPDENTISFECWLPIKAGSTIVYEFAFPSSVSATTEFPSKAEIAKGLAGSGSIVVSGSFS